jgi:hypothetical protein
MVVPGGVKDQPFLQRLRVLNTNWTESWQIMILDQSCTMAFM